MKKYIAEFIGTLVLVLFSTGVAVITGGTVISFVTVPLAFGLSIVAMAYVIGNISGCHVNPAVSLAMLITGKMKIKDFCFYVIAQVAGAFAGSGLLYLILNNTMLGTTALGANGYLELSMTNITLFAALLVEVILTFVFVYTVLGVTSDKDKGPISGLVIGGTLAFVHLLGIPLTGTSVNPARSLAPAVLTGGVALQQVWVFIVAPFVGGAIAALVFLLLNKEKKARK